MNTRWENTSAGYLLLTKERRFVGCYRGGGGGEGGGEDESESEGDRASGSGRETG